jgi:beta-glucosidase-like glycosyl hydrolase
LTLIYRLPCRPPELVCSAKRLGFQGIIMSDDLAMAAISGDRTSGLAALMALQAGVDMVMVSGIRQALQVRDALPEPLERGS